MPENKKSKRTKKRTDAVKEAPKKEKKRTKAPSGAQAETAGRKTAAQAGSRAPRKERAAVRAEGRSAANGVRVIPLGGIGEVGKNMTLIEYENDIIIIDCGLGFPEDDMPGIDLVIPDLSYLEANREKVRAVLLTHGHEDHIGAIPYFLRSFNVPVYGTALTIGIIRNKLREHRLAFIPQLITVHAGDKVKAGVFEAEFIHVNHSIPDSCAICVSTPAGRILHTGDFKLDVSPIEGNMMDLTRFGELGRQGIRLMLCESTNAERHGYTPSERSVGGVLETVFAANSDKRIVVATFSSNVHRVMQIINVSVKYGRKVAITGRSMQAVISAAIELGYMTPPPDTIIDVEDMKRYPPGKLTLVTTGSQGEPMSALYRMAFADHSQVTLGPSDVVVLSSSAIPGNEKLIDRIINELTHNGIKVINDSVYSGVHASGHACSEEIKMMIQLCRPSFYMPVHGEYRHLAANREIAQFTGIDPDRIITADIGTVVELKRGRCAVNGTVPSGRIMIDGLGVGDIGKAVLRDRKHLSEDGIVILFASVDLDARLVLTPPEIISKGFVYLPDAGELINLVKETAADELSRAVESGRRRRQDLETIRERVRRVVIKLLNEKTGRNPIVIPFITDL